MRLLNETLDLTGILPDERKKTPAASFTAYLPDTPTNQPPDALPERKSLRPAVIVCPGGGYERLSVREGEPVALKYLAMGYSAFVLHYSVAPDYFPTALLELAILVGRIRTNACEWDIDPHKIIVSGFSAGGHLAASLGVFWNQQFVWETSGLTPETIRPNGLLLCYPVITSGEFCHPGSFAQLLGKEKDDAEKRRLVSLELQAGSQVPPTFLWHTVTDASVPVENSILFAQALLRSHVSVELHLFPRGCHGLALATEETCKGEARYIEPCCQSWLSLAETWLKNYCYRKQP
ncbi:MAG: alpha/beta hydrolase [Clostridiales bacterium]|nr:alpha/beta hydrolase [Clostridiales bacterium]